MLHNGSGMLYLICFVMIFPIFIFGYGISLIDNAKIRKNVLISISGSALGYIIVYIPINYFIKGGIIIVDYMWIIIATVTMMTFFFLGYKSKKLFQSKEKRGKTQEKRDR